MRAAARRRRSAATAAPAGASASPASSTGAPAAAAAPAARTAPAAPRAERHALLDRQALERLRDALRLRARQAGALRGFATTVASSAPRTAHRSRQRGSGASARACARAAICRLMSGNRYRPRGREQPELRVHVRRPGLQRAVVGGREQVRVVRTKRS